MHQRDAARAVWYAAGLAKTRDAKLRCFLQAFDSLPNDCWPQVVALIRNEYPEYIEQLAAPLWKSGDVLMRVNLIRYADLSRKNEAKLIARWTAGLDVEHHRYELAAVVQHGKAELLDMVLKRKKLPDRLRLAAHQRRLDIPAP